MFTRGLAIKTLKEKKAQEKLKKSPWGIREVCDSLPCDGGEQGMAGADEVRRCS